MRFSKRSSNLAKKLSMFLENNSDAEELYYALMDMSTELDGHVRDMTSTFRLWGVDFDVSRDAAEIISDYFWQIVDDIYLELYDIEKEVDLLDGGYIKKDATLGDYIYGGLQFVGRGYAKSPGKWNWKTTYKLLEKYYIQLFNDLYVTNNL